MRRGVGRPGPSNLPVPKASRGSPSSSLVSRGRSSSHARSAEDLSQSGGSILTPHNGTTPRRAMSPGGAKPKTLSPMRTSQVASSQAGVRYITEDLIRKIAKEESMDMISSLNLTLAKEGGKKIKYIENLEKLRKLQILNLGHNMIERMEKLDKLLRLRELNLSYNCLIRIEGIENLTNLQVLNVSGNNIEHIPVWLPKKLQALRTFRIADNRLSSLSELAKLKALPDLIQLEVSGNPLSDLPHARLYVIFHLRCVEILDGQQVTSAERSEAQNRFALDEVQTLERQLEKEESRYRQLEESHNRSEHERSQQETSQHEMREKERKAQEQMRRLQQELQAKDDLLKRKTTDLNKACEKHYQLEQELAFYKIDSKFQSLGEAPPPQQDVSSDSGGLVGESPYIGRARYQANQLAQEGQMMSSPQRAQMHSLKAPLPMPRSHSPRMDIEAQAALDAQLEAKKRQVAEAEEKLKSLQLDLSSTESKLLSATQELKKMAPDRNTPEPFRDDNKFKIRQKLAKKMQTVNVMRDNATQMEDEIDRIQMSISQGRNELTQLKTQMQGMDQGSPAYNQKQRELTSREQQINEDHLAYGQMQHDLETTLQSIARETNEIKRLEEHLTGDQIEQNESLKSELDDIVSGLQGYLEGVKGQSMQHRQEFQLLLEEKEALEEKIRRLEAELAIMDAEAQNAKVLQKQLEDAERELSKTHNASSSLQEDLHRSRQKDMEVQSRLEEAENEARRLGKALAEAEKKAQAEKKAIERQLQTERERMEKMTQRVQDANRQDLEAKKLLAQLEAAKALNSSLRDQMEDLQQKQLQDDDSGFKPSELKKRLRKFTHDFKTNKSPADPANKDDFLGASFKEIYQTAQDKLSKSVREAEEAKKVKAKAEAEMQTLKERLKKAETQLKGHDNKKGDDEKKRLQDEVNRLQASLKQLKEGGVPVRIVYAPSDGSVDRASSLDSDEKLLYDELQRELMDLKRHMRQQDQDASRKVMEAETEAAHWQEELKAQQKQFEEEMDKHRQEAELLREKQEARIQVIAQDLDQAQYSADTLQQALRERETVLQDELSAADMSNQMISSQEEELARLYEILEAQRGEIENLNQMLDYLATQGPDGVGPGFDDELWRIRQEVNRLKETLAMQSAYVQGMPNSQSMATQVGLPPPFLASVGVGGGVGGGLGSGAGGSRRPTSTTGAGGSRSGSRQGFTSGLPFSHPSLQRPGSATQQQRQTAGDGLPNASMSRSGQSSGVGADPRATYGGHMGNERRESKAPPGSRTSMGKRGQGQTIPGQRSSERGSSADRASRLSVDRSRRAASVPSAFEPVHRPEPFNPLLASPSRAVPVPPLAIPESIGFGSHPSQATLAPSGIVGGAGPPGTLTQGMQTAGVQGPTRAAQTGGGGGGVGVQPQIIPMPVPVYAAPQPQAAVQAPAPVQYSDQGVGGTQVAFDPIATQYSYSDPGGASAAAAAGYPYPTQGVPATPPPSAYSYGAQTYVPVGPAQTLPYQPSRAFVPAGADGGRNARIYYPAGVPIPMPAPGAPPPPPPLSGGVGAVSSPVPPYQAVVPVVPVVPIAAGTPVRGGHAVPVHFDGSFATMPPSPIRASGMESPTRGILKNSGGGGGGDDSYLFCNVPEHHDLEDYIAELQDKLKRLKGKLVHEKNAKESIWEDNDKKVIKRLLNELEDRRDELEGLDLAIERQKRSLKEMKREERGIKRERSDVRSELERVRERNNKKLLKIIRRGDDSSFDEAMEKSRQRYLQDEIECLERTLAKRQTQLREAERALKDTNSDLKEAKEQARETVKRYDDATTNLHNALSEQQEIDRRANEVGAQLVKNMDQLAKVKVDLKDLERKRSKQERLLKDINQVISKKDTEFRDLDSKVKASQQSLQRVQEELAVSTQREKDIVDALRESEDILGKRRAEIARMREQYGKVKNALVQKVDSQRAELERLDKDVGRKKTELQILLESYDRQEAELKASLRQLDLDVTGKRRELQEEQAEMEQLDGQKTELLALMKAKRAELRSLQEEGRQEEEVVQRLAASLGKSKAELKHAYDLAKLERTELDNLRAQHAHKLQDLEVTQRHLLEEKSELEQLNAETSRKAGELERLRQAADRERGEVETLTSEKQKLEERIATLSREQSLLDDSCRSLDDKVNTMKRTQRITEEKIDVSSRRLESLEEQLAEREKEMEDSNLQRTILQKDVQMLKQNVKDSQAELQQLQENIRDAEATLTNLRQDLRAEQQKRDSAHTEAQRLADSIRHTNSAYEEALRQERAKQEELQDLIRSIEDREREHDDARKALNRVRKEIEKEENKMNKLLSNANNNLEQVRQDLMKKQEELDHTSQTLTDLRNEASHLQANSEQFAEMQEKIKALEVDMEERNKEKNELANALSVSYEEVQRLRKESTEAHEKLRKEHVEFETALNDIQQQLEHSRQELQSVEQRSAEQVSELQALAEQQFQKANALREELDRYKEELIETKKQLMAEDLLKMRLDALNVAASVNNPDLLECDSVLETAFIADSTATEPLLTEDKENLRVSRRAATVLAKENLRDDINIKRDQLRERLVEEQHYLRFQLQQQMLRHNEMMESARKKSDETIDHLKRKLNSLHEVLFNSDVQAIRDIARSRSHSPVVYGRKRSPSPGKSYLSQRRSRSRSFERMGSPIIPERDCYL